MRNALLGVLTILYATPVLAASENCSTSTLLGYWEAQNLTRHANYTSYSCARAAFALTCGANNELKVEWAYRCGTAADWHQGNKKIFSMNGERIAGQDGHLKQNEFYWDGLISYHESSKLVVKSEQPDQAAFEFSENLNSYEPEDIFRGTFRRVTSRPAALDPVYPFPISKIHGPWTGELKILGGEKERNCPIPSWELNFDRHRLFQVHFYIKCEGEQVDVYVGPSFVRDGILWDNPRDHGRYLKQYGTVHAKGWERTYDYYVVRKEIMEIGENDTLSFRLFYKFQGEEREYQLRLRRP